MGVSCVAGRLQGTFQILLLLSASLTKDIGANREPQGVHGRTRGSEVAQGQGHKSGELRGQGGQDFWGGALLLQAQLLWQCGGRHGSEVAWLIPPDSCLVCLKMSSAFRCVCYKSCSGHASPLRLKRTLQYIKTALDDEHHVYIHCRAGVHRAPSLAAVVAMCEADLTWEEAESWQQWAWLAWMSSLLVWHCLSHVCYWFLGLPSAWLAKKQHVLQYRDIAQCVSDGKFLGFALAFLGACFVNSWFLFTVQQSLSNWAIFFWAPSAPTCRTTFPLRFQEARRQGTCRNMFLIHHRIVLFAQNTCTCAPEDFAHLGLARFKIN